jgi:phosphoglucosamine mutase
MRKLFGTDGVRGVANLELTAKLAFQLGRAGAHVLALKRQHASRILVGKDTRISGDMLEAALIAGICSVGAEAVCLGVIPTPAVAYLTRHYGADAGVIISASHNPFEFNGIKFIDNRGYKLPDSIEEEIESYVLDESLGIPVPPADRLGRKSVMDAAQEDYVKFAAGTIDTDLSGLKVLLDCANGASYEVAPKALRRLGADVDVINNKPDGININNGCGSTHMEQLQEAMKTGSFDVGLAFDGDADRVLAVDEHGNLVDGDIIMAMNGLHLKINNRLRNNTIVATVMSNMGLDIMARREGINLVKTKVGDRYVLEEMIKGGHVLGGEQSGHIIFLEHSTTGDGLLTALQLLAIMKHTGQKLSELSKVMQVLPQVLKNARVSNENKNKYENDEIICKTKERFESELAGEGRILVRPSGTEPLVRVMIEGKEPEMIDRMATELVNLIEERLG